MEQNLNTETELENQQQQMQQPEGTGNAINFATIFTAVVLNWKWFVLSIVICLGLAAVYLRYATPIYQVSAKLLIKDNDQNSPNSANKNAMLNSATLGLISNSNGFDNEMEILTSHSLALASGEGHEDLCRLLFCRQGKRRAALQTAADQRRYG